MLKIALRPWSAFVASRARAGAGLLIALAVLSLPANSVSAQQTVPASPAPEPPSSPTQEQPAPPPAAAVPTAPIAPSSAAPQAERPPPPRPLLPPAVPAATEAFKVLDKHCARCHQGGRLKRAAPAAGLGNILRLDEIARDPTLVRPGNPDASRLYTHTFRRLMPFDVHQEQSGEPEPTSEELLALRSWISALPQVPACQDRRPVTIEVQAEALRRAAEQAGPAAPRLRFVSLAHLYNACATPEAMYSHRQALLRLFNSLSWKPTPVRVEPIDDARTLLRIDLDDLGWLPTHWERILRSAANGPGHLAMLPTSATEPFGVAHPAVRGDWLADTVLRAPLYYDLLGLPALAAEIARIMQIDADAMRRGGLGLRETVRVSGFSEAGRLIDRLGERNRVLWTAHDLTVRDGRRDLSEQPLPAAATPPPHDAALSLFLLPNGLPAYFVANGRGDRIDQVPADIARRSVAARFGVRPGLDCMGCHSLGPAHRNPEAAAQSEISRYAERDRDVVREGLQSVGIEPGFSIDGIEPVTALAREFTRPLSELRAAAELGLVTQGLSARLNGRGDRGEKLVRRLLAGLVNRGDFEADFAEMLASSPLLPTVADPKEREKGKVSLLPVNEVRDPGPALVLLADKIDYRLGDALRLTVRTSADCHLTLISIDQRGRGTVLFPSDFETNNLLAAGRELHLPAEGAPYLFRLKEKGRESIVALCNTTASTIDGIRHDFERQRFTDLGDYAAFLTQAYGAQTAVGDRRQPVQSQPAVPPTEAKGRGRRTRNAPARPETTEPTVRPRAEQLTHTAITIDVK